MPAAVVAAPWFVPALLGATTAAGTAVGGIVQGRASGKATEAQERAANEALAYQRAQEAKRERQAAKAREQATKNWWAWYDRVGDAGIRQYGVPSWVDFPAGRPTATTEPAGTPPRGQIRRIEGNPLAPAGATNQRPALTIGDLAGFSPAQPTNASASLVPGDLGTEQARAPFGAALIPGAERKAPTLADLANWGDWRRYGVG